MPPSPDQLAEARALVRAQAEQRSQIESIVAAAVVAEVRNFNGWYSSPEITKFAGRLAKLVRAGQRQAASSTSSYATRLLTLLLGRRPPTPGVIAVDDLRGGVPLESVYGRLADEYRFLTATRGPDAPVVDRKPKLTGLEILDRVTERAEVQTGDNLSLAMRDQWGAAIEAAPAQVTGYRRVIHPEVIAVGSQAPGPVCGLCLIAADRTYSRAELLPLHARCRCDVQPIVGAERGEGDPGFVLNREDFKAIYAAAGSTAAADLKRTKIRIAPHGELGPRLILASDHVRTAADAELDDEFAPSA